MPLAGKKYPALRLRSNRGAMATEVEGKWPKTRSEMAETMDFGLTPFLHGTVGPIKDSSQIIKVKKDAWPKIQHL